MVKLQEEQASTANFIHFSLPRNLVLSCTINVEYKYLFILVNFITWQKGYDTHVQNVKSISVCRFYVD